MGLGSVVSGLAGGGKSAKKAAAAAIAAQKKAMEEYQKGFDYVSNNYSYYEPQAKQGWQNFNNTLTGDMSAFNASPYGQFYNDYIMNNTIDRLQGTAAAKGNFLSGNTLKELQTNIQSILSSDYLNRLGQYLGYNQNLGQTALGITDALNQYRWKQAAANAGAQENIGNIQAAQYLAKANNNAGILSSLGGLDLSSLAGSLGGLFGGSSDDEGGEKSSSNGLWGTIGSIAGTAIGTIYGGGGGAAAGGAIGKGLGGMFDK